MRSRWRAVSALHLLGLWLGSGIACAPSGRVAESAAVPVLGFESDPASPAFGTFTATELPAAVLERLRASALSYEGWTAIFPVCTGTVESGSSRSPEAPEALPPLLGTYAVVEGGARFTPRFPPVPGRTYTAVWHAPFTEGGKVLARRAFRLVPPELEPAAEVLAVYPGAAELPANLLKLYVRFSAPMSRGEAHRRTRLLDVTGGEPTAVEAPFVAPERELWNPSRDRLTLIFDPGRVKQGLRLREELGPPLVAGRRYRLEIDAGWPDARGVPLRAGFTKSFRAVAPDRAAPAPTSWRLRPPAAAAEPVTLSFPEPLDHALLQSLLTVHDEDGALLAGEVEIGPEERGWSFHPARPWSPGRYRIRVDPALEDLAGNSPRRLFDAPLGAAPGAGETAGPVMIPFEVGGTP